MKIVCLMPMYKVMDTKCVQSLVKLQSDLMNDGHTPVFIFANNCYITYARNSLLNAAASVQEADYVLCLDSDHIYEVDNVYKLIKDLVDNNLDMISAKYYVRNYFSIPRKIAALRLDKDGKLDQIDGDGNLAEKGIQDVDAVGFGFLLMKHSLVKTLIEKKIKLFQITDMAEDVYFCNVIKQLGYRVCYDADVVVGHVSTIINK